METTRLIYDCFHAPNSREAMAAVGRQCEYTVFGCSRSVGILSVDAGHVRTTAVAVADFLDGVSERQVPKWTGHSLRKPLPAAMGRVPVLPSCSWSTAMRHRRDLEGSKAAT